MVGSGDAARTAHPLGHDELHFRIPLSEMRLVREGKHVQFIAYRCGLELLAVPEEYVASPWSTEDFRDWVDESLAFRTPGVGSLRVAFKIDKGPCPVMRTVRSKDGMKFHVCFAGAERTQGVKSMGANVTYALHEHGDRAVVLLSPHFSERGATAIDAWATTLLHTAAGHPNSKHLEVSMWLTPT